MIDQAHGFWSAYAGRVDDVVPFGRLEALRQNTSLSSTDVQIEMDDTADSGAPFVGWFRPFNSLGQLPGIDTIYEVSGTDWRWEDEYGGTDKSRLISVLQAGTLEAIVHIPQLPAGWTTASMAWGVRVHEFGLVVSTKPTVAPPCQIYPRDDGQGAGGAAIWPPPSSGRPGSYY
jgi:hypothetical protein